ncbi:immunomodulatory protein [Amylostereum chailletii]|nr:immunomodulatory protein [Amylostereum chailletii]
MTNVTNTGLQFLLAYNVQKVCFDYTPQWERGNPGSYINTVTFPKALTDQGYQYRVRKGTTDLGVRGGYTVQPDGSQKVNFLDYNGGRGIEDSTTIKVYVVDPTTQNEYLIAQWN